jgi:hypothetical protein
MVGEAKFGGKEREMLVGSSGVCSGEEVGNDYRTLGIKSLEDGREGFQREFYGRVREGWWKGVLGMKGKQGELGVCRGAVEEGTWLVEVGWEGGDGRGDDESREESEARAGERG